MILVSSLRHLQQAGLPFVFTDSHAYYAWANYYSDLTDLNKIDWQILQHRDFKRDERDPAKFERYQAEALVYQHVPLSGIIGIICYTEEVKFEIEALLKAKMVDLPVYVRQKWYHFYD